MKVLEWGAGYIGDDDNDGHVDIQIRGLKLLGMFSLPDVKVELPTGIIIDAARGLAKSLPAPFGQVVDIVDRFVSRK